MKLIILTPIIYFFIWVAISFIFKLNITIQSIIGIVEIFLILWVMRYYDLFPIA